MGASDDDGKININNISLQLARFMIPQCLNKANNLGHLSFGQYMEAI